VAEIRQTGMILAIDVVRDRANHTPYPWQERRGRRMHRHALEQGVLLRPLGETIYFMPPYVITPGEIDHMIDVAAAAIDTAVRD
jgi:adenosylmethionine-8-amino-7-oxononanoate aminotransferase